MVSMASCSDIEAMQMENYKRIKEMAASKHGPSDAAMILQALVSNPNFKCSNPRWLTERIKEVEDHEMRVMFFRALESDPDLFYKILLLGSAGTVFLGAMISAGTADSVIPDVIESELKVGGLVMIPAGITMGLYAAIMLAVPRVFGPNGIILEAEAGGFGIEGSIKIG